MGQCRWSLPLLRLGNCCYTDRPLGIRTHRHTRSGRIDFTAATVPTCSPFWGFDAPPLDQHPKQSSKLQIYLGSSFCLRVLCDLPRRQASILCHRTIWSSDGNGPPHATIVVLLRTPLLLFSSRNRARSTVQRRKAAVAAQPLPSILSGITWSKNLHFVAVLLWGHVHINKADDH